MILTSNEFKIFNKLFFKVSIISYNETDGIYDVYKIKLYTCGSIRHRLLAYLIVNNLLYDFIVERENFLMDTGWSITEYTSTSMRDPLTDSTVTFQWNEKWTEIFNNVEYMNIEDYCRNENEINK